MEERRNAPKLRFPGFTDPWEQRKLGDVATIVGGGTPSTNNDAYWDGEIDWYSPAELGERVYADRSVRRITQAGYDSCSATLLPAGKTILFTSRAGIGNTAILRRSACTNQGFQSLVVNDDIDVYFVYSMTDRIKKFAEQKASGSTFLEISGKGLAAGEFAFPSKDEQTAIGSMFKQLDNLITLHQRELDHVKELKKGLLQKMFPKEGANVPELRFPGFTDPWEQRRFGELALLRRGLTYAPDDVVDAQQGTRVLRSSNINEDRFELSNDDVFVREDAVNIDLVRNNDILITAANGSSRLVGKRALIKGLTDSAVHGGFMLLASTEEPDFFNAVMGTEWYRRFLRMGVAGGNGALGNLDSNALRNRDLLVPKRAEQKAIGVLFAKLDSLIALHQRELDHVKELKKGLLQQMFV